MDIREMAKQLGEAISTSKEFVTYAQCETEFKSDADAQALLMCYNDKRGEYAKQMQSEDIKPMDMLNIRKSMAHEYSELLKNDIIKRYTEAKAEAEKLLTDVNAIIQYCVTGEDETQSGGHSCSGSCETCGGCH